MARGVILGVDDSGRGGAYTSRRDNTGRGERILGDVIGKRLHFWGKMTLRCSNDAGGRSNIWMRVEMIWGGGMIPGGKIIPK